MGTFTIDGTSRPGMLQLKLEGRMTLDEMIEFVAAHNAAIDAFRGRDYRVLCDISSMLPLDAAVAEVLERAKRYSSEQPGFRGSGVLVASATVAMQHRRTSADAGVIATELISSDRDAIEKHLSSVHRG